MSGAGLIALCMPVAFAQSQSTTTTNDPTIQQRKENQQDRIAQGVQSGQLTAGETKNLETKEAGLNKEEHTMRSGDDGHLTSADRTRLNNQQNRLSNQIYGNGEIGQPQENQQDRIAQGIKNGKLSPGETARLENQQQGINREVSGMRQANGGKLTGADRRAVNQQQNKASRSIYNKKHDGSHK